MRQYAAWLGLRQHPPRTGLAYVAVRVAVYAVALVIFVLIYGIKDRGLLLGPPVGLVGGACAWYLLGDTPADPRRRLLMAAGVSALLGELTWAFGYWNVVPLVGGAGLWLAFYVLTGVMEHGASHSLDRRIMAEYALVALIGALVILVVARPWSVT